MRNFSTEAQQMSLILKFSAAFVRFSKTFIRLYIFILVITIPLARCNPAPIARQQQQPFDNGDGHISIGPCTWVVNHKCPDENIRFYLFTRDNVQDRQLVHVDETWELSNISASYFDPKHPTKIIIHGYNSDMFLQPLIDMKDGKLEQLEELEKLKTIF